MDKEGTVLLRIKDKWEPVGLSLEAGVLTILKDECDLLATFPVTSGR